MTEKSKRNLEATKKSLVDAAAKLMTQCSDANEVTSRAIAKESGANQAMINYCFGSREGLLYEVFKKMLADAQAAIPRCDLERFAELPPKQRIIEMHFNIMKLMIENYNYSKAITSFILLNRSAEFGMESLPFITEHFAGRKTVEECRLITFELTGLHELSVLKYEDIKRDMGIDLTESEQLRNFVKANVERFLD